jgi:arsenate reductase (thioredoxin)
MKKLLFVCMRNAARSQIAEAFFNFYASASLSTSGAKLSDVWQAESGGIIPAPFLNEGVIEVMNERGVDVSGQKPKKFDLNDIKKYDRVITFVPLAKGGFTDENKKKVELWNISDPLGRPIESIEEIANQIEHKIKELVKSLGR